MKGGGINRPPADVGVPADIKTLLEAFKKRKSLRLVEFYEVAIDHGLIDIYGGRLSVAALVEYEESLLNAAFAYVRPLKEYKDGLGEERSLEERIFGVYAIFVLYYLQPVDYVSKIRLTPSDINDVERLVTFTLIPQRCLEAYGCLHRLFSDNAFTTTALVKQYDLSHQRQYETSNPEEMLVDEQEQYVKLKAVTEVMEHSVLKAMTFTQKALDAGQSVLGNSCVAEKENLSKVKKMHVSLNWEFFKMDHELEDKGFSNDFEDFQLKSGTNKRYTEQLSANGECSSTRYHKEGKKRHKRKHEHCQETDPVSESTVPMAPWIREMAWLI